MTEESDREEEGDEIPITVEETGESGARNRIEEGAERAVEEFDEGIVDLLAWLLDTETRSRIYVYLRQYPDSTSQEVAEGTGLYPSTVREALAALHEEEIVTRSKRESEGAGNNPYEYRAIPPSELVGALVGQLQEQLNSLITWDPDDPTTVEDDVEPITIDVEDATERDPDTDADSDSDRDDDESVDDQE